jgi:zinc transporter 5/7
MEALERVFEPPEIISDSLLLVAFLGFCVNMVGLVFFHEHAHGHGGGADCPHGHGATTSVAATKSNDDHPANHHGHSHGSNGDACNGHGHDDHGHSHGADAHAAPATNGKSSHHGHSHGGSAATSDTTRSGLVKYGIFWHPCFSLLPLCS